jgi:hypothetical protein
VYINLNYDVEEGSSLAMPSPYVKVYLVEATFGHNKRDIYSKKKTRFVAPEIIFKERENTKTI